MTKSDKILLICCFIAGYIVMVFVSGCSKQPVNNYTNIKYEYTLEKDLDTLLTSTQENELSEKITVYTSFNENNEPIKMASCKGCHFVCPKCVE